MNFRNVSILSVLVFGILALFLCKPEPGLTMERQSSEEIIQKIVFSDDLKMEIELDKMDEHKHNLTNTIIEVRDKLIEHFVQGSEEDFMEMGNILARRGAVLEGLKRKYTRIHGQKALAGLFKELETKYEGELMFEVRHVFIDKIFEEKVILVEGKEERVDKVARIFFRYRLIQQEGDVVKNVSGGGSFESPHRHDCPWY